MRPSSWRSPQLEIEVVSETGLAVGTADVVAVAAPAALAAGAAGAAGVAGVADVAAVAMAVAVVDEELGP